MAEPAMSVTPYWELTFDADGDPDGRRRDRLLSGVTARGVRDLVVFAHGWNNDRSTATRLYSGFFAPMPSLAPTARLGYAGVVWPSMRFPDEPIPDFPRSVAAGEPGRPTLDKATRRALLETFPGRATVVDRLAELLDQRPGDEAALTEFAGLARLLADPGTGAVSALDTEDAEDAEDAENTEDTEGAGNAGDAETAAEPSPPGLFTAPAAEVCEEFAAALAHLEGRLGPGPAFSLPNPWDGAQELLRQLTYHAMKRRAGTVGERGLGRLLGHLAQAAPHVRVHLVGHSFGARLVSFALRGLPPGVATVKSVTLLQGAFSHYAFADRLPHDTRAKGALAGRQRRVDGPVVCCHSRHDSALGTFYPLASRTAGDDRGLAPFDLGRVLGDRWGALGYEGIRAVPGTRAWSLAEALDRRLPASGCVNVDAAAVVRRGGPPAGAHSDIVHRDLARLVLAAGRVG
ncbi:serine-threonine protein kinase [Streptomyces sp. NPDC006997]|uniref:serine-threonine protein kinase n=1 Tax=Streptomyces sp. NPDC006997 TaxID=3155356 RepID=UPI0033DBEF51